MAVNTPPLGVCQISQHIPCEICQSSIAVYCNVRHTRQKNRNLFCPRLCALTRRQAALKGPLTPHIITISSRTTQLCYGTKAGVPGAATRAITLSSLLGVAPLFRAGQSHRSPQSHRGHCLNRGRTIAPLCQDGRVAGAHNHVCL